MWTSPAALPAEESERDRNVGVCIENVGCRLQKGMLINYKMRFKKYTNQRDIQSLGPIFNLVPPFRKIPDNLRLKALKTLKVEFKTF